MNESPTKTSTVDGNGLCERHNVKLIPGLRHCQDCEVAMMHAARDLQARREEEDYRHKQPIAGVPPRFLKACLDGFIANTDAQRAVLGTLKQFAESSGTDPRNLILAGTLGTGKTFAGFALVNGWLRAGRSAVFTTALGLVRSVRDTWNSSHEREAMIVKRFTSAGLLVIDEIGVQSGSPSERAILADVINTRYENLKPTVVIGNLTKEEFLSILGERALDRLKDNGRTLIFDWENRRGKT